MKHAKNKLVAAVLAPLLFVGAAIAEDKTFSEDSIKETAINLDCLQKDLTLEERREIVKLCVKKAVLKAKTINLPKG